MKKAGIALTGIALVAAVLYAVRAPLSTVLMGRVLERNMATSLLDTLPDGLNVVLCGAGGPLPECYLWMLQRLGGGWADIAYGSLDLSARTVVTAHACKRFPPHQGRLGIGIDTDPFHLKTNRRHRFGGTEHRAVFDFADDYF